ncbi:hypothetical protein GCM10027051_03970 [Niabella terrae]
MNESNWWNNLESQWKQAFGTVFFKNGNTPGPEEIRNLLNTKVLRLAGPRAPYPNMGFELSNLSGIQDLQKLEILVVTHHQLQSIQPLSSMKHLKSLFLFNNQISSLKGIEDMTHLEQLYVQYNRIDSLRPLKTLTRLKEVYINNNHLASLDGLTEEHSENLVQFFCKPNDRLKQKEIIHAENQLGIRCRSL